jgi:dTDP-4-amino-4,6-dideoxygalactose transaminase
VKVPFLSLNTATETVRTDVMKRFESIIDSTGFVCGKNVAEFEESFAALHGVKYTVGLDSGTAGNQLAVMASDIGNGDEVIVPANTFIATAEGVSMAGATPVFVDVLQDTFNIDPDAIAKAVTQQTKAINPVHLFGQPADMDAIRSVADRYGLKILEDCAQSHCADHKGQKTGGLGNTASWSFYPGKNMGAWGEAGALTTNDEGVYLKARMLRDHGSSVKYHHDLVGHNFRMSEFQGAVLAEKCSHIERWTEKRRQVASWYDQGLNGIPGIVPPAVMEGVSHVYHLYVIQVKNGKREALQEYLAENEVASGLHYPVPLHLTKAYQSLGYGKGDLPIAEQLAQEILSLPMYPELSDEQVEHVCNSIKEFIAAL